jgi:hypothetical protein
MDKGGRVMTTAQPQLNPAEAAAADGELAELRRVRRLREDLELDHPAIEIILRMGRRIQALQAEVRRLELTLRAARRLPDQPDWLEAEWDELF